MKFCGLCLQFYSSLLPDIGLTPDKAWGKVDFPSRFRWWKFTKNLLLCRSVASVYVIDFKSETNYEKLWDHKHRLSTSAPIHYVRVCWSGLKRSIESVYFINRVNNLQWFVGCHYSSCFTSILIVILVRWMLRRVVMASFIYSFF